MREQQLQVRASTSSRVDIHYDLTFTPEGVRVIARRMVLNVRLPLV
jgi:hypothetical protein